MGLLETLRSVSPSSKSKRALIDLGSDLKTRASLMNGPLELAKRTAALEESPDYIVGILGHIQKTAEEGLKKAKTLKEPAVVASLAAVVDRSRELQKILTARTDARAVDSKVEELRYAMSGAGAQCLTIQLAEPKNGLVCLDPRALEGKSVEIHNPLIGLPNEHPDQLDVLEVRRIDARNKMIEWVRTALGREQYVVIGATKTKSEHDAGKGQAITMGRSDYYARIDHPLSRKERTLARTQCDHLLGGGWNQ